MIKHEIRTIGGPIYDSEGLLVMSVHDPYELICSCGWRTTADTAEQANELALIHNVPATEEQ